MPQFQCTLTRQIAHAPAGDADEFTFEVMLTPAAMVGQPGEPAARRTARVTVNISRSVLRLWDLDADAEAAKRVAFFYAIEAGIAEGKENVILRTENAPKACPYNPALPIPTGPFKIAIPSPPIGFRA